MTSFDAHWAYNALGDPDERRSRRKAARAARGEPEPLVVLQDRLFSPGPREGGPDTRCKTIRKADEQQQLFTPQDCPACGGARCGCPAGTKALTLEGVTT